MNPPTTDMKNNIKVTQIMLMCLVLKKRIDYYPIYVYVYLTTNISTKLNDIKWINHIKKSTIGKTSLEQFTFMSLKNRQRLDFCGWTLSLKSK